jgi:TIR domain
MKVFLSYASEDRQIAEEIQLALTGAGHNVFFDRESLAPAGEFHSRLRSAIDEANVMVFLISPPALTPGSYTLSELKFARERWPHPKGCVIPVLVRPLDWAAIPSYLRTVTVLQPEGNTAAEVVAALDRMGDEQSKDVLGIVRTSDNEIILATDVSSAVANVRSALERVGRVTTVNTAEQSVEGKVRFGLQSARLRISAVETERGRTRVVVQASGDDIWGAAAKSATRRLVETLSNLNNPGYRPDRLGMHPAALVGVLLGFILLLLFLIPLLVSRLMELLGR